MSEDGELLQNPSGSAPWIIQKYGGTSVGKSLESIGTIVESYLPSSRVAIVCSARSSQTKALGTTNLLLKASRQALQPHSQLSSSSRSGTQTPTYPKRVGSGFFPPGGGTSSSMTSLRELEITPGGGRSASPSPFTPQRSYSPPTPMSAIARREDEEEEEGFGKTVDILKRDHLEAARKAVKGEELREELVREIEADCEGLRGFLSAAQIINEISPRSQDSIVGTGERLACKIVAASLRDRGIDSELVVLDTIVDAALASMDDANLAAAGDQGVAQLDQSFYDRLAERLGDRIRDCGDRVPVITGYFGPVPGSLLAQIGRGYTDLCAALCAVGIKAAELQVWKEVDGIFTADPRKVPTARLVPVITPDEAAELTYYGSEVIHPFTMEQVIRAKIPIRIKNVENPKGQGTVIYPDAAYPEGISTHDRGREEVAKPVIDAGRPTAVTIKDSIIVINIHSNRKTISHGFLARIFGILDRAGVVVDLISTSEVHVSMALQNFMNKKQLERLVRDLEKIGHISISEDMAILSLVGKQMRNAIGLAGQMFATLAKGGINIEMISQGASEINISCVIDEKDAIKALNIIHQSCLAPAAAAANGFAF